MSRPKANVPADVGAWRLRLLRAALEASTLSQARFATEVLDVEARTIRYWLRGERAIPGPVVQLCRLVVDDVGSVRRVLAS